MDDSKLFIKNNNFKRYSHVKSQLMWGKRVEEPDISIMIPTFKRSDLLNKTIESVLTQKTTHNIEICVVDNDDCVDSLSALEIVKRFESDKLCYFKNEQNIGMFGNMNRCIELAGARWLLILHDDDVLAPGYIDEMMRIANCNKNGAVSCEFLLIDENNNIQKDFAKDNLKIIKDFRVIDVSFKDFYMEFPVKIWGTLFNTSLIKEIGGFDESLYPVADTVLLLNFLSEYGISKTGRKLFYYRWAYNESLKLTVQFDNIVFLNMMRKYLNDKYKFTFKSVDKIYRQEITKQKIKQLFVEYSDDKSVVEINKFIKNNGFEFVYEHEGDFNYKIINLAHKIYRLKRYLI